MYKWLNPFSEGKIKILLGVAYSKSHANVTLQDSKQISFEMIIFKQWCIRKKMEQDKNM